MPERRFPDAGSGTVDAGTTELLASLRQLQVYATGLGELVRELGPAPATGTDPTGTVRVRVGADGLPEHAEVHAGWRSRLSAGGFARAVAQAAQAASAVQADSPHPPWSDDGREARLWRERLDRLGEQATTVPTEGAGSPSVSPWQSGPGSRAERSPDEVLEDALRWAQRAGSAASTGNGEREGTGRVAGGSLVVVVSPRGLDSCRADPGWADWQTGEALGAALTDALMAARADLRAGGVTREANGLFAELMALMEQLGGRVPTSGTEPSSASGEEQR